VCVCARARGGWVGVGVDTGLFSSLLSVVNSDYRILTWKVCLGSCRGLFLRGRTVKEIKTSDK
jgi:hypothetical protein